MKSIGWVTIEGGGGPINLMGDATGPSDNNTVTAIHAAGVQYPFGALSEGQTLIVSGGQIVGGSSFSLTGDVNGPSNNNTVDAIHGNGVQYPIGALVEGELLTVSAGAIVAGGTIPTTLVGDANGSFGSTTVDSIHANAVQYPFGALVEGEVLSVSGGQIVAGGTIPLSLGGDANGPINTTTVTSIHSGGVPYTLGALANGETLIVSGGSIVAGGPVPTTLAGDAQGPLGATEVRSIHESGNQELSIGSVPDGGVLTRSGTNIIGVVPQNNLIYRLYGSFTYLDTEVFLFPLGGLPANALVVRYDVAIATAFDDVTAVVTLGWFGNPEGLLSATGLKENAVGTYGDIQHVPGAAGQSIQLFISAGGSSQGSGTAMVEYILT